MSIKLQSISASERWLQCTKSLEHNQGFVANAAANYGSLIHDVAALRLDEIFNKTDNKAKINSQFFIRVIDTGGGAKLFLRRPLS